MKKSYKVKQLQEKANIIRQDIIKMLAEAGSGHSAGSLGLADIFVALYFNILNHDPKKPKWEKRDRLCLSNGHVVPVRYAAMARSGYFSISKLKTLRKLGSPLQGHPSYHDFPALEHSSGPLGQGVSVAVGMALAAKLKKQKHFVYCITSDGEHNEGQTWEAVMAAAKYKLDNLIFIVDRNMIQIDGFTKNIMPLNNLYEKYQAFKWHVQQIDGNDMKQILKSIEKAKQIKNKPKVIIAHTIPGKGVSFMENKWQWHGKVPSEIEAERALKELQGALK
ncbi:MAG: transketolase [Candidatus Buchananbacteria bacterium]|nr:transketolase [Candidatus Buchananbacteria bacterium]